MSKVEFTLKIYKLFDNLIGCLNNLTKQSLRRIRENQSPSAQKARNNRGTKRYGEIHRESKEYWNSSARQYDPRFEEIYGLFTRCAFVSNRRYRA